ncbi:preprotein translocase subunit SecE [Mesomycoplasma dispar]|uniref:Preprotein translocase subunit SecE n=1 Tax=Mesomycoplasma dispar TaxID=86660 RepID=A0AAJ5NSR9_9BACT|nr:preprotein translocase subunit SecE [Mesomycoplasma dispar]AJR12479.1 preprotein translocase subunit SecE [Mesomycoplasma dispar]VEU62709.1 preprotein translocase subunit SecE [Mesomycoplasma dispar]
MKKKREKESKTKKIKKTREKKYFFRLFVKEMKRVKWPSSRVAFRSFGQSIVFSTIFMVVFFAITIIAALIWNQVGVGI